MKYVFITSLAGALLLVFISIVHEGAEPPGHLIYDMVPPQQPPPRPAPPSAVQHESSPALPREDEAALIFARHCAACHGASGTGRSYVAAQPGMPEVNDLTVPGVTPEELFRTLSEGRGAMPAHAERLSEQARRELIRYITHTLRRQ